MARPTCRRWRSHPARQGGGLGRQLLDALLVEARARRAGAVLLEVRAENAAAKALYARAGFEQIGVRRGYYRPGGTDALVLRLRLDSIALPRDDTDRDRDSS